MPFFASPIEAEEAFYRAFRNLDIAGMQRVWADTSTVYCIHPTGQLFVGQEAVLQSWSMIFQGVEKPRLDYLLAGKSQNSAQAVHLVEERIGRDTASKASFSAVLATNVYVLTDKGWRIFSHHASQSQSKFKSDSSRTQMH